MEETRKPFHWLSWLVISLVVVSAYPLSFGPACRLMFDGYISRNAVLIVYRPLILVSRRVPTPIYRRLMWSYNRCLGPQVCGHFYERYVSVAESLCGF